MVWKRAAAMVSRCLAETAKREFHEQRNRDVAVVADDADRPAEEPIFCSVALAAAP